MRGGIEELYDYDVLRQIDAATAFVVRLEEPTLVLGGSQSVDVLAPERTREVVVRRRRGGGGLVLLRPDDLWVDWWIPAGDSRWSSDVHVSSERVGSWWRDELRDVVKGDVTVHHGSIEGSLAHRVVCFAGRGPGEVFVDGRKAVGVTQWRVREGTFLSTVIHGHSSVAVAEFLREVPPDLIGELDHHVLQSLGIEDPEALVTSLLSSSGPWQVRQLFLTP